MRNLIQFIIRYHVVLLFLMLETLSLVLLFNANDYHKAWLVNKADRLTGNYYLRIGNAREYLHLRQINEQLSQENTRLRNQLEKAYRAEDIYFYSVNDSLHQQQYYFTPAKVIDNSVNKRQNFLTLNKGKKDGIREEMGVISNQGLIGLIVGVSDHFSVAISLLNTDFKVSAKILKNDYYGSLSWPGHDYRYALLSEIPHHVHVDVGDTIVTSGYSSTFPEGVLVGTVESFSVTGGSFLEIEVRLSVDFKSITYVNVVSNLRRFERDKLEKSILP
jgi:rod shape-determining protein MreC